MKKPEQLNNHLSVVPWKVQYFSRFWIEENASALIVFMYTIILWKWMVNGASALAFGRIYYTYMAIIVTIDKRITGVSYRTLSGKMYLMHEICYDCI